MLKRTGLCIVALALTGQVSPLPDSAAGAPATVPELSGRILELHERAGREPGLDLLSPGAVQLLEELARLESDTPPAAHSTSVLLREVHRLASRVDELEAELRALHGEPAAEPLVRIRVARGE